MTPLLRRGLALALIAGLVSTLTVSANPIEEPAFERTWERTDRPVADGVVSRTWMWGPSGHTPQMHEEYLDAPGGERLVQYFDKTRMEINDPDADPGSIWYVTNGLLATELITGRMQIGDNEFVEREPAEVQVAGDDHADSPTYATFTGVLDADPLPTGETIVQTIDREGNVGSESALAVHGATAEHYVEETENNVASVFWEFMNSSGEVYVDGQYQSDQLFENPFFAVGLPITEAYWVHVPVAGEWKDVLAQCFERRCLTYTPDNDPAWQVEAANIGQHYYQWRYDDTPAQPPEPPEAGTSFTDGTYVVGDDIQPGRYVASDPTDSCYWERVSGFSGELDDIIANSFTDYRQIVEIQPGDAGFVSERCGEWVLDGEPVRADTSSDFGDGIFLVGDEITPGTWQSTGDGDSCYWARLDGFSGELADIHANHFGDAGGIVEISDTDVGFETSQCGDWTYLGE